MPEIDERFMRRALELARLAEGRTSPNPMVGAVVVKDGVIVGEGYHRRAGSPHAEINALEAAGQRARGADLYVTLEPCNHFGRTPPCTDAIIAAGLKRVVAAVRDPNPLAGGGLEKLAAHGITVQTGLLENEARRLNKVFFKYNKSGQPFVLWKTALTLDGKTAARTGDSRWVTGLEARRYVHQLRDKFDGIMVGIGTVLADDPSLTTRLETDGRDPIRLVVDSRLRLPLSARVVNLDSPAPTWVATVSGNGQDELKKKQLQSLGVEILEIPGRGSGVDLNELLLELGRRQVTSLLLEGGGELAWSFVSQGLVDEALFMIAPKLLGGRDAPTPLEGSGFQRMADALPLHEMEVRRLGEDILVSGYFGKEGV